MFLPNTRPQVRHCKSVSIRNFYNNNCIEYESNDDKNKTLSIKEYLREIRPYLSNIINNPKKSDISETQLAIARNFMSSQDTDEEFDTVKE